MERMQRDEEEREQEMLKEQIEKATKEAEERGLNAEQQATDLKRDQGPIKLNMSLKPAIKTANTTLSKPGSSNKMKMMMKTSSGGIKKPDPPKHLTVARSR